MFAVLAVLMLAGLALVIVGMYEDRGPEEDGPWLYEDWVPPDVGQQNREVR